MITQNSEIYNPPYIYLSSLYTYMGKDLCRGIVYSQTSEQRTLWEQYKFKSFVLCREVVLFSEVQNILEPSIGKSIIWDLEKRPL